MSFYAFFIYLNQIYFLTNVIFLLGKEFRLEINFIAAIVSETTGDEQVKKEKPQEKLIEN